MRRRETLPQPSSSQADVYAVIMAGGQGTRFWPRSRRHRPKQLLHIIGERTMLEQTVARIEPLIPPERIVVVAGEAHGPLLREVLPQLPRDHLLLEPIGRNTAACVAWAALWVQQRQPDAVMVVLPADHAIGDEAEFRAVLATATAVARTANRLVTIGIRPTHPETGYGYIRVGHERLHIDGREVHRVERFVEKPSREKAAQFLAEGGYLWNSGMFIWRVDAILQALQRHLPQLVQEFEAVRAALADDARAVAEVYPRLPSISIDVGVLEQAADVWVVPGDFGWSDVGSWRALSALLPADAQGNVAVGELRALETSGCLIYSPHKLVAAIGITDLVVIDTEDVLLICPKHRDQEVRTLVELLEREGRQDIL
jgi:mannose-1-phosphate guanylyltransferase